MRAGEELVEAIAKVKLRDGVHGPWSRAIAYHHLYRDSTQLGRAEPLWAKGPAINGARYTPEGGCDAIYLADNPITAFAEVLALVLLPDGPIPVVTPPWVVVSVDGVVSDVLDLTDADTRDALGTNIQELTGAWVTVGSPPTQLLGQIAFESGRIAGIQYPSAKSVGRVNLVVFPDRLTGKGAHLETYDPYGHLKQRLEASSRTQLTAP